MYFQKKIRKRKKGLRDEGGFAMMVIVFFFLAFFTATVFGFLSTLPAGIQNARYYSQSHQAFYTASAGVEDVIYRLSTPLIAEHSPVVLKVGESTATTSISTVDGSTKAILSEGALSEVTRNISVIANASTTVGFKYTSHIGRGGIHFRDAGSAITGDVFSNGPVDGDQGLLGFSNIFGDLTVAGPSAALDNMDVNGDVYVPYLNDVRVGGLFAPNYTVHTSGIVSGGVYGDAYYETSSGTFVTGTETVEPYVPKPYVPFPIPDSTIEAWKQVAASGGTYTDGDGCPVKPPWHMEGFLFFQYKVYEDFTVGYKKIPCDLVVTDGITMTLSGPVWVEGDIRFGANANVTLGSVPPGVTVPLVADNESNRITSSRIKFESGGLLTVLLGLPIESSKVIFVSMNNSAESGGGNWAIYVDSEVQGNIILYAPHGKTVLRDNADLDQITTYELKIGNGTQMHYDNSLQALPVLGTPISWNVATWEEVE